MQNHDINLLKYIYECYYITNLLDNDLLKTKLPIRHSNLVSDCKSTTSS